MMSVANKLPWKAFMYFRKYNLRIRAEGVKKKERRDC